MRYCRINSKTLDEFSVTEKSALRQIFPEIPMQDHDIFMDKVITEKDVYQGLGRS